VTQINSPETHCPPPLLFPLPSGYLAAAPLRDVGFDFMSSQKMHPLADLGRFPNETCCLSNFPLPSRRVLYGLPNCIIVFLHLTLDLTIVRWPLLETHIFRGSSYVVSFQFFPITSFSFDPLLCMSPALSALAGYLFPSDHLLSKPCCASLSM